VDRIGGWEVASIGQNYGQGYALDVLTKWMRNIDILDRLLDGNNVEFG